MGGGPLWGGGAPLWGGGAPLWGGGGSGIQPPSFQENVMMLRFELRQGGEIQAAEKKTTD